jgi:adenosylcobinamide kinase/adenosylcobinamide-phosphate guanylyltransferase
MATSSSSIAVARTLILGGVRSGKSRLAERLALESGLPITYVATATHGDDPEMVARIAAHQKRRPTDWALVEEPLELADTLARVCANDRCVLVDCLTLWLANLLWHPDPDRLTIELDALDRRLPDLPGQLIMVGNEVGLGIIPTDPTARRFGDLAGELHQRLAGVCDRVLFTVAGLPLTVKDTTAIVPPTPGP